MHITITTRGGDHVAIDLSSLLTEIDQSMALRAIPAMTTGAILTPVAPLDAVAPIDLSPAAEEIVAPAPVAPAPAPAPKAPRKPRTPKAPKAPAATAPVAPVAAEDPAARSLANKALFRQITALKRAKRFDEATALAAAAGWSGEVDSIARKRAALAAAGV